MFLRKIEHRLQIMLDLQTHVLPESDDELGKLALRMGYGVGQVANLAGNVGRASSLPSNAGRAPSLPSNVGRASSPPQKRPIGPLPRLRAAKDALLGDYRQRTG